jgi:NADH:ubiquinone oxidoreductase subunit C
MLPTFFNTLPLSRVLWTNFGWYLQARKSYVPIILSLLKVHSDCEYKSLVDTIATDNLLSRSRFLERFTVKYFLVSFRYQSRISLGVELKSGSRIYSVTSIFSCADWSEREIWDLFGIYFVGHFDLRRLLTDYGFRGHPLLKDFPLRGHKEAVYNEKGKRVTFIAVQLAQGYRRFFLDSPWAL